MTTAMTTAMTTTTMMMSASNAAKALLVAAVATAMALIAACGPSKPRPFDQLRERACACKDVACAEGVERDLALAIAKRMKKQRGEGAAISATRHCMYEVWRAAQPADLFRAEAEPPPGPGPCDSYFEVAPRILACERAPIAVRTRVANDVLALRTSWNPDGTPRLPELDLYDLCLAALSPTMGVETCERGQ